MANSNVSLVNSKNKKNSILTKFGYLALVLGLTFGVSGNVNAEDAKKSKEETKTEVKTKSNKESNKKAKEMKVRISNKSKLRMDGNIFSKKSGVVIDGVEIERVKADNGKSLSEDNFKLDVTEEQEKAIELYNKDGLDSEEMIAISEEVISIEDAEEETDSVLVRIVDSALGTERVNAAYKVTKTNYWGAGYEVYKTGSQILYCVQYGPLAGTSYKYKNDNLESYLKSKMGWSDARVKKATKQALWGTYYTKESGASTTKGKYRWYASAQSLIWNGNYHPGADNAKKTTINGRVSKHDTKTSFEGKTYKVKAGNSLTIKDAKGELSSWFSVRNAAAFKSATGITVVKSGNNLKFTNPAGNTRNSTGTVQLQKYVNQLDTGNDYALYGAGLQSQGRFTQVNSIISIVKVQAEIVANGKINLHKDMDDIDLYGGLMNGSNGNPIYATVDGKKVVTDGSVTIDTLKYPTEAEMTNGDLFEKSVGYTYTALEVKQAYADDKDKPINDINDKESTDPDWIPTYEQTLQDVKDEEGNPVYTAKLDGDGNPVTARTTLDGYTYPTKKQMDNIYDGEGIKFNILNENKQPTGQTMTTDKNGNATSGNLAVGTYYLKETATKSGFILLTKEFKVTVVKDITTPANDNKPIVNRIRVASLEIDKVDTETKEKLTGVNFGVYDSGDDKACSIEDIKDENMLYSGITDKDGKLEWESGTERTVCIQEIEGKAGYLTDDTVVKVDLKFDEANKYTFTKENQALNLNLQINKENEEKEKLAGVKFRLDVYGDIPAGSEVPDGETGAGAGEETDTGSGDTNTKDGKDTDESSNETKVAALAEGDEDGGNEGTDPETPEVPEVPDYNGEVEIPDGYDYLIHSDTDLVTDENGNISLSYNSAKKWFNAKGDSYYFVLSEVQGLEGYKHKEAISFFVGLSEDGKSLVMSENEFSFPKNIKLEKDQTLNLTVINEKEKANAVLTKVASDDKSKQIATYNFKFYDNDGKVYRDEDATSTLSMPKQLSVALMDTSKICASEVKAPNNFVLNTKKVCKTTKDVKDGESINFDFENDRKKLANTGFAFFDLFH